MSFAVGVEVWVPCRAEVWRPGRVVGVQTDSLSIEASVGSGKTETLTVPHPERGDPCRKHVQAHVHLRSDELKTRQSARSADDLERLPLLNEPAILHSLHMRFDEHMVYTRCGPVLLAMNPFREVPGLYSSEHLRSFADLPSNADPPSEPHIFAVARAAYHAVRYQGMHQTVLVSGESGAGKTESTKFIMRYLALAGNCGGEESMSAVEQQVLETIPILEAFGNAKTLRNDNSSRFGKFIELHFGRVAVTDPPRLIGARIDTYLLEKVRVIEQQEGERGYHIFYQMLAAAQAGHPIGVRVQGFAPPSSFAYLRCSGCTTLSDGRKEEVLFETTLRALRAVGFGEADIGDLFRALIAVLHIGNVTFSVPAKNSEASEPSRDAESIAALALACELLEVDREALMTALCRKSMRVPGQAGVIRSPVSIAKAVEGRDALARHVYSAIFVHVVRRINEAVAVGSGKQFASKAKLPFIGLLDIFGFEFFDKNSLEQLLINYTNEVLQKHFNDIVFEYEQRLYSKEDVAFDSIVFPDNRLIVDLIGENPTGILPMLDEECRTIGGSSEQWRSKMEKVHGHNSNFALVKLRQQNFVIQHFAGPVEYTSIGCLEKNKDMLGQDLVTCLKTSTSSFVQHCIADQDRLFGTQDCTNLQTGVRRVTRAKVYSVGAEFCEQLSSLMDCIQATESHFVRCIKPNTRNVASKFDRQLVVGQLRYQGVLQAIELSRLGFPMRLRHRRAVIDYRCLVPPTDRSQVETEIARNRFDSAARILFPALSAGHVNALVEGTWAVGKTMVFLRTQGIQALSCALSKRRVASAIRIQTMYRCVIQCAHYKSLLEAVLLSEALARRAAARRRVGALRRNRAALRLQSFQRGRHARVLRGQRSNAASILGMWMRGRVCRLRHLRTLLLMHRITRWWRQIGPCLHGQRRERAALQVQRAWRGYLGRCVARGHIDEVRRRQTAARLILRRWQRHVLDRVLPKPVADVTEARAQLENGSTGELLATVTAMQQRCNLLERDAQPLIQKHAKLCRRARMMEDWTLKGMLLQLSCSWGVCCTRERDDSSTIPFTPSSQPAPSESQGAPPQGTPRPEGLPSNGAKSSQ